MLLFLRVLSSLQGFERCGLIGFKCYYCDSIPANEIRIMLSVIVFQTTIKHLRFISEHSFLQELQKNLKVVPFITHFRGLHKGIFIFAQRIVPAAHLVIYASSKAAFKAI
jgi:hypothetical protein